MLWWHLLIAHFFHFPTSLETLGNRCWKDARKFLVSFQQLFPTAPNTDGSQPSAADCRRGLWRTWMQSHPKFLQISHNNLQDLNPSFLGNLIYFHGLFFRSLISGYYQNLCSISMNLERSLESFSFGPFLSKLGSMSVNFEGSLGSVYFGQFLAPGFFLTAPGFSFPAISDTRYPAVPDTRHPAKPGAGKKNPAPGKKNPARREKKPGAGKKKPGAGKKKPGAGKKNPAPESKIERFLETHRNWTHFG